MDLEDDAPGRYALLSLPHVLNLANQALLIGPFALLYIRRAPISPPERFAAAGALGALALIGVHDLTMWGAAIGT